MIRFENKARPHTRPEGAPGSFHPLVLTYLHPLWRQIRGQPRVLDWGGGDRSAPWPLTAPPVAGIVQRVLFPYLEGTGPRCTEGVARGVARIPTPFVREMVLQKVLQEARAGGRIS